MVSDRAAERPPAQKATDQEIVEALERVIGTLEAPAVPTAQVAAELPIARQTVKRRLDTLTEEGQVACLSTGQGRIWWVPEDGGGHVDPSTLDRSIDPQSIDPYDIPPELAREIAAERVAGFDPPETFWERLYDWSDGRADDVVALVGVGLVVLALPAPGLFEEQLSPWFGFGLIDVFGTVVLVAGLLLAVVAAVTRIAGTVGGRAASYGYVSDEPIERGTLAVVVGRFGRSTVDEGDRPRGTE